MIRQRVPLTEEPISGAEAVEDYDRYARRYMLPVYRYFVRKILNRGIRKGRVLDIGTGPGYLAIEVAKARNSDFTITALDMSAAMIEKAKEISRREGTSSQINFVVGNASTLPFPKKSFD